MRISERLSGFNRSILTVPNVLCMVRIVGSFALPILALGEHRRALVGFFIILAITDWLDGKLAIILNQKTEFGARLDSFADVALYSALLSGCLLLARDVVLRESVWIAGAVGIYVVAGLSGYMKFKQWPSYHTRLAKISWFATAVAAVSLLAGWSAVPLRIAMSLVFAGNLESVLITVKATEPLFNIQSFMTLVRKQHGG